jgi:hypothetical protein
MDAWTLWLPFALLGIHLGQLSIDFLFDHYSLESNKEMVSATSQYYLKLHQQPFPYPMLITTPGFLLSALLVFRIFKKRHKEDILTLLSYLVLAILYQYVIWAREDLQSIKRDFAKLRLLQRIAYLHLGIAGLCVLGLFFQVRLLYKWTTSRSQQNKNKNKTN